MKKRALCLIICFLLVFLTACSSVPAPQLPEPLPDPSGSADPDDSTTQEVTPDDTEINKMTEQDFQSAINYVKDCRRKKTFTYAAFAVGNRSGELFHWTLDGTNETTLFDLASLTKIASTTSLFLVAQSEGLLHWDDTLGEHLNAPADKASIPLWRILSHSSGLKHYSVPQYINDPSKVIDHILASDLAYATGTKVQYCCNGYNLLAHIIELKYGKTIDVLYQEKIASVLGMTSTGYKLFEKTSDIAKHQSNKNRVNDSNAHFLGDVAGNAGLFSNILDMSIFATEMANGLPHLIPQDIFLESIKNRTKGLESSRSCGWNIIDRAYTQSGRMFSNGSYGHTGHTGQSIYVDRETGLWVVLLTNARYHVSDSEVQKMREGFHNALADDLGL